MSLWACSSDTFTNDGVDAATDVSVDVTVDARVDAGACVPSDTLDFHGCPCAQPNAKRDCWLGPPGDASACSSGVQQCTSATGSQVWSACSGATAPAPEVCFDGTDNDCNGIVDDGCLCTSGTQSCMAEGGLVSDPTWRFYPSPPVANKPLEIVLLTTKAAPKPGAWLKKTSGGDAPGCIGDTSKACVAGSQCGGWNAIRYEWTPPGPGSYNIAVHLNDNPGPCDGNVVLSTNFVVP
jgi:hypothetical protein